MSVPQLSCLPQGDSKIILRRYYVCGHDPLPLVPISGPNSLASDFRQEWEGSLWVSLTSMVEQRVTMNLVGTNCIDSLINSQGHTSHRGKQGTTTTPPRNLAVSRK